jgi:hypothetical protein
MSFGFVSFQKTKFNAIITSTLSICFAQFTIFFWSIKLNMNQLNSSCMQCHSFKVEDFKKTQTLKQEHLLHTLKEHDVLHTLKEQTKRIRR